MLVKNIEYIKSDKPNAETIVLINGLFADKTSWNAFENLFIGEFNILKYDGEGQGSGPIPTSAVELERSVEFLHKVLQTHAINRCSLIGLSNGGRVALQFAATYSDIVSRVVACDCYSEASYLLNLKLESWLKAQRLGGAKHRFDVAAPWVWGESIVNSKPELIHSFREKALLLNPESVAYLIEGAMSGVVTLEKIQCQVLLGVGEEDLLTPYNTHVEMAALIKNCKLIRLCGGHASLLEYPIQNARLILDFLMTPGGTSELG